MVYRVDPSGLIVSLRAIWEPARTQESLRPAEEASA